MLFAPRGKKIRSVQLCGNQHQKGKLHKNKESCLKRSYKGKIRELNLSRQPEDYVRKIKEENHRVNAYHLAESLEKKLVRLNRRKNQSNEKGKGII